MSEAVEADMVKRHAGLVIAQALSFKPNTVVDRDDLIQVGFIGLLRAVRNYDPRKSARFGTFAVPCIRHEMLREIRRSKPQINIEDIDTQAEESVPPVWEVFCDELEGIEREVIYLRLQGKTFKEIGEELSCSKWWANKIYLEVVDKLKEANDQA